MTATPASSGYLLQRLESYRDWRPGDQQRGAGGSVPAAVGFVVIHDPNADRRDLWRRMFHQIGRLRIDRTFGYKWQPTSASHGGTIHAAAVTRRS